MTAQLVANAGGTPWVQPVPTEHPGNAYRFSGFNGESSVTDAAQRYRFNRVGMRSTPGWKAYIDPTIVFEETLRRMPQNVSREEAVKVALSNAQKAVSTFIADHRNPLYAMANSDWQRLQTLAQQVMNADTQYPIPVGASGHQSIHNKTPRGVTVSGTGNQAQAQAEAVAQARRREVAENIEYIEFTSVDGQTYRFPKGVRKPDGSLEPSRGFWNMMQMLSAGEMLKGGSPYTPWIAAGSSISDADGKPFVDFSSYRQEESGEEDEEAVPSGVAL